MRVSAPARRRAGLAPGDGARLRALAAPQRLEQRHGAVVVEVLVVVVVHLEDRRVHAAAEALHLGQGEHAVRAGLAIALEVPGVLAGAQHLVRAAQPAGRRAADLEVVAADRLGVEHQVEGGDLVDADRRHAEALRHHVHRHARHPGAAGLPPHLPLHEVERRDHRARLLARRVALDDRGQRLLALLVEVEVLGLVRGLVRAARRVRRSKPPPISWPPTPCPPAIGPVPPTRTDRPSRSTVDLPEDDVERADDRHRVGQHVPLGERPPSPGGARSPARGSCSGTAGWCRPPPCTRRTRPSAPPSRCRSRRRARGSPRCRA